MKSPIAPDLMTRILPVRFITRITSCDLERCLSPTIVDAPAASARFLLPSPAGNMVLTSRGVKSIIICDVVKSGAHPQKRCER